MTDEQPWMSKDLLLRLRWWAFKFSGKGEQENLASDAMSKAVSRIEELEGVIRELMEFVDNYSDVVDGDYGVPEPNRAMSLLVMARDFLGR